VRYGKEIADRIFRVTSVIRNVLVVFLALLAGVSILLISNTIRLSIYARRREVEIMKLVGATNWFIRWPFVIEGMAVGVVGAFAALAVVQVGTDFVITRIRENLMFLTVPFNAISPVELALILLGVGVLIGASGSGLGLRRFLNV
jgi:cell division transport system permease protein